VEAYDGSFSYHDSEASTADDNEEEFGEGASGCSPLVMGQYVPDGDIDGIIHVDEESRK